jgi:hypothetical protein
VRARKYELEKPLQLFMSKKSIILHLEGFSDSLRPVAALDAQEHHRREGEKATGRLLLVGDDY